MAFFLVALAIATLQDEVNRRRAIRLRIQKERNKRIFEEQRRKRQEQIKKILKERRKRIVHQQRRKKQEQISKIQKEINKKQVQGLINIEQVQGLTNIEQVQGLTNIEQGQELTNIEQVQEPENMDGILEEAHMEQAQDQTNMKQAERQSNMEQVQEQTCLLQTISTKRSNSFNLPDDEFINLYRLSKPVALKVIELLQPFLEARTLRKNVVSVDSKVLCALQFYATGSEQRVVSSDSNSHVKSQRTVSKILRQVTEALNRLLKTCVKFPKERSIQETIKEEFYEYCGLSGVLGAVGCTHVALQSPIDDGYHQKTNYLNSKNFYSLKVQLVCNSKQKILDVVASFPGSTDDAYIWKSSSLRRSFGQKRVIRENSWLIGDNAYPSEPWLKTPILSATTDEELSFNSAHSKGMSIIKKVNGTLKSRFQCLKKKNTLRYDPVTACKIINACVVLHNICVENDLVWTHDPLDEEDEPFTATNAQDSV